MCIIAGGLKSKMKREELVQGMKSNDAGFYLAVLRGEKGQRKVVDEVRTLDMAAALDRFDKAEDGDLIVSHARIPSHGNKSLENVHGWESDGVRFMHNGTMTNVSDLMPKDDPRTDSEYFFREIFIPLWKSQGRNFNPLVERVVNAIRGSSRFCFIMPNGDVNLFGDYVKDHECWFSNSSYRTYSTYAHSSYGSGFSGGSTWGRGTCGFGQCSGSVGTPLGGGSGVRDVVGGAAVDSAEDDPPPGKLLSDELGGAAGVSKLVLTHIVLWNAVSRHVDRVTKSIRNVGRYSVYDDVEQGLWTVLPTFCCDDKATDLFRRWLTGTKMGTTDLKNFLEQYSEYVENEILDNNCAVDFSDTDDQFRASAAMANVSFDWTASKLKRLATCWEPVINRKHQLKMVETSPEKLFSVSSDIEKIPSGKDWHELADNLGLLFETVKKGTPKW